MMQVLTAYLDPAIFCLRFAFTYMRKFWAATFDFLGHQWSNFSYVFTRCLELPI